MTDYHSYDYLGGDLNLPRDPLAPEFDRVGPYSGEFTADEVKRAERVLADNVTISLHDHPVRFPDDMTNTPAYNRTGRQHTAFDGLAASGLTVVFDNMMDGTATVTGNTPWQFDDVVTDLGMRQADVAHQSNVVVIRTADDIHAAHAAGKVGLVFGLEAATPIGNDLDKLDVLYGLGIRQIGIAYSDSNGLGAGLSEPVDFGLTKFGRAAIRRMNQLGLAIDVSHSSDLTGIQAADASDRPVFMTHAGAKAVWNIPRLKSDDALKAIAATGGVIGMSAAPHTTVSHAHPKHSILSVMDHFLYCLDLVGIDHVAFGPDTLYGDHVGLHSAFAALISSAGANAAPHERVQYVDGLENPTENFHNIAAWLVHNGFSDEDMVKVLGGNIVRALDKIWV
jgi:membrane dipeptidase